MRNRIILFWCNAIIWTVIAIICFKTGKILLAGMAGALLVVLLLIESRAVNRNKKPIQKWIKEADEDKIAEGTQYK